MPKASTSRLANVDRVFRAMSDQTRLRILNILQTGELCVCDIVCVLKIPQPTASRHLAYLRKAGLVVSRKQDQWNYYQLATRSNDFHHKLLECLSACADMLPKLAQDLKHFKQHGRSKCST